MTQVQYRPQVVTWVAAGLAVVFVAAFTVAAVVLRRTQTGVYFQTSDQVSLVGIGVALAAGVLLFTRPRVRADAAGIEIRNVLRTQRFDWTDVREVSFPDGARWARVELAGDEYVPILAIQSFDLGQAVQAMRELRRLHREAAA